MYLDSVESSASFSCVLQSPPAFIAQSVLISIIYFLITCFLPCVASHSPSNYPLTWACFDHSHYKNIPLEPTCSIRITTSSFHSAAFWTQPLQFLPGASLLVWLLLFADEDVFTRISNNSSVAKRYIITRDLWERREGVCVQHIHSSWCYIVLKNSWIMEGLITWGIHHLFTKAAWNLSQKKNNNELL